MNDLTSDKLKKQLIFKTKLIIYVINQKVEKFIILVNILSLLLF